MCGIMGFSRLGKVTPFTTEVLRETLAETVIRGRDATGVAAVYENRKARFAKHHIPGDIFAYTEWFDYVANPAEEIQLFIGHCRATTHGSELDNKNNHPHVSEDGRWFLVHNGVMNGWPKVVEESLTSECDSEVLLHYFSTLGAEDGIKAIVENTTGDYAFFALDAVEKKLYFYSDGTRPLVSQLIPEIGGFLLSSTDSILQEGYKAAGGKKRPKSITVPPYHLFVISADQEKGEDLGEFKAKKVAHYGEPYRWSSHQGVITPSSPPPRVWNTRAEAMATLSKKFSPITGQAGWFNGPTELDPPLLPNAKEATA